LIRRLLRKAGAAKDFWRSYGRAHDVQRRAFFSSTKIHRANKYLERGRSEGDAERLQRAYNDYRGALQLDSRNAQALYGLGVTLYESAYLDLRKTDERLAEAESALTESLSIQPENSGAVHYCRGLVLSERWRRASDADAELARRAVEDFTRACESEPDQQGYWCAKGMALTKLAESLEHEPEQGREFCRRAGEAFDISIGLGGGALPREEWADALLTDALTLDNPDPEPLLVRVTQLFEEAETDGQLQAGSYWRWALTLETLAREPGDENSSEHVKQVLSLLDTALRVDPEHAPSRELREEILARTSL
jgi:tetratricopeptide (TPR) repeat protein